MPVMPNLPRHALLDDAGLNRQHVFNLADLPADLLAPLDLRPGETQLLLFGHAGRRLARAVMRRKLSSKLQKSFLTPARKRGPVLRLPARAPKERRPA